MLITTEVITKLPPFIFSFQIIFFKIDKCFKKSMTL